MHRMTRKPLCHLAAWSLLTGLLWTAHAEAADVRHGQDVFAQECAECHSPREGKNKKGPSLFAVARRKAGTQADFVYSEPMLQSAIVWTPAALDAYIANPRKAVPGGKMKYEGLADSRDRENLIAYLSTLK